MAWLLLPIPIGITARLRSAYLKAANARAEYAERTREEEARHRAAEERMRIARELRDVVAHHLALANAQAGTVAHLVRTGPGQAEKIAADLADTISSALRELKGTVGLLRQPDDPAAPLEPAPGLAQLPVLGENFRSAGGGRAGLVTIRVLLADDQALLRETFRILIDSSPDMTVVGEAADGSQAVQLTQSRRPDVVVMDIRMPGTDGLAATAAICGDPDLSATRVLILTTFEIDQHVARALRAGASAFLGKDVSASDLLAGIRTVASGDALLSPQATRALITRFLASPDPDSHPHGADRLAGLTARQRQMMALAAEGYSNQEIAEKLFLSPLSVRTQIQPRPGTVGAALAVRIHGDHAARPRPRRRRDRARSPGGIVVSTEPAPPPGQCRGGVIVAWGSRGFARRPGSARGALGLYQRDGDPPSGPRSVPEVALAQNIIAVVGAAAGIVSAIPVMVRWIRRR